MSETREYTPTTAYVRDAFISERLRDQGIPIPDGEYSADVAREQDAWHRWFDKLDAAKAEPVTIDREGVRIAVGGVLFNASNFPGKIMTAMLGQDMGPLIERTTDAVIAHLAACQNGTENGAVVTGAEVGAVERTAKALMSKLGCELWTETRIQPLENICQEHDAIEWDDSLGACGFAAELARAALAAQSGPGAVERQCLMGQTWSACDMPGCANQRRTRTVSEWAEVPNE